MQPLDYSGVTMQTGNPGLIAGTTTTYTIATAFNYAIRGKSRTKATATNAATPTTDANTAAAFTALTASKGCVFVWMVNAAGTVSVAQGPIFALSGETDCANASFSSSTQWPNIPATACPFGYEVVKVGASGANWTMGSSNQASVANVSIVFEQAMTLPDRPQVL